MSSPDVITFGCRLNAYESEVMRGHAAAAGLDDVVIINTCTVTAEAERQARQSIRRLRRERPGARIIVTGCAVQVDPEGFAAMPEVDHIIGNDRKLEAESFRQLDGDPVEHSPELLAPVVQGFEGMERAFVQVQNGCDHRCTFCIIPYGRGASRSVPMGAIAQQMRALVAQGYNEIVMTGVDIASYGKDLPGQPTLGQMIRRVLALVPELPRLRLSSLDPAAVDEDIWRLIADELRLMPHLHLSLQAGDDMILKRMKRRHDRAMIYALCERARRLRPDIVFGADIIAGFPTESEAMFDNTVKLVEECGLTWLHIFPYSARKGTPAAKMPQVHGALRKARAETLRNLGALAEKSHLNNILGSILDVLVERSGVGCTPQFARIPLMMPAADLAACVGKIIRVQVRLATTSDGAGDAVGRVVAFPLVDVRDDLGL